MTLKDCNTLLAVFFSTGRKLLLLLYSSHYWRQSLRPRRYLRYTNYTLQCIFLYT